MTSGPSPGPRRGGARKPSGREQPPPALERYRSVIPDWRGFLEAAERPEPTVLRVRTGRISEPALVERLRARGYRLTPLEGLPSFYRVDEEPAPVSLTIEHWLGLIYVQQASTGVAAPALAPEPGERVLDLCSAPGGKTTHAADLMGDEGCVVAADVSEGRIRGLLGNVYRLGHTNVMVVASDGTAFPEGAAFDRALVDAPCTGEGTLRKRAGRPPRQSASFLGYVRSVQERLLRRAVRVTRPGGTILYVTCTFAPEENEAVVDAVLRDEPVALEPLALPVAHAPGLTGFEGARYHPDLEGAARIYPHHFDSGGLFLARLRRLEGGTATAQGGWGPVPPVFPGDDTPGDEAGEAWDRAREALSERFGLDASTWDGVGAVLRGGRLWLHTLGEWPLQAWPENGWRPISAGFRAVEFDSGGFPIPTNDFFQWAGPRVTAGAVDASVEELRSLLDGGFLDHGDGERGPLALRHEGDVLGRIRSDGSRVVSELPRAKAADLVRALGKGAAG